MEQKWFEIGYRWGLYYKFGRKTPFPINGNDVKTRNSVVVYAGEALARPTCFSKLPQFGQHLGSLPRIL